MRILENWQSGFWHLFEKFWQISGGLSSAGSYVPLMMSHRKPSRTARAYFSQQSAKLLFWMRHHCWWGQHEQHQGWSHPTHYTCCASSNWSAAACWEVSLTPRDLVIRKLIQFQPRSASRFLLLPKQPHKLLLDREWHNSSQPAVVM